MNSLFSVFDIVCDASIGTAEPVNKLWYSLRAHAPTQTDPLFALLLGIRFTSLGLE